MSKLRVTERYRRVLSSVLWIAFATCIALGLSAGAASAQDEHKIEICHKGQTISVDIHSVIAHLEHGDFPVPCNQTNPPPCGCTLEFNPVTCTLPDGTLKTFVNRCVAACAGARDCGTIGACSDIFNPVRCTNAAGESRVFANQCQAELAGFGSCAPLCPCPQIYAPVRCGNGKTYVNACVAQCDGASGCTPL
jgi:hypothetical protein